MSPYNQSPAPLLVAWLPSMRFGAHGVCINVRGGSYMRNLSIPGGPLARIQMAPREDSFKLCCRAGSLPDCKSVKVFPLPTPHPTDSKYFQGWRVSLRLKTHPELASTEHPSCLLKVYLCPGQCGLHEPCWGSLGDAYHMIGALPTCLVPHHHPWRCCHGPPSFQPSLTPQSLSVFLMEMGTMPPPWGQTSL